MKSVLQSFEKFAVILFVTLLSAVLPAWSRLVNEQSTGADPARNSLEDARGLPLLAMSCEFKRAAYPGPWTTTPMRGGIQLRPRQNARPGTIHKCTQFDLFPDQAETYRDFFPEFQILITEMSIGGEAVQD